MSCESGSNCCETTKCSSEFCPNSMTGTLHACGEHVLHSHTFPIFQTSTFMFDSVEHGASLFAGKGGKGHVYSRLGNPTVEEFEKQIARMEGGVAGLAFGSGMGAIASCIWPLVKAGDHILWGDTLYGCTVNFLEHIANYGVESTPVDTMDLAAVKAGIKPNTKVIYLETPANPTNRLTDIAAVAEFTKGKGITVIVDNTFTTPIFQRPLELGADVVVHSVTKYINGHGDVVGGCAAFKCAELAAKVAAWRKDNGAIMGPFDAWLVLRGIKTLPIRMQVTCKNALAVAEYLENHPKVACVLHPGLKSFPQYELGKKQMSGYGGTFSILMKDGFEAARSLCQNVKVFGLAVSLGTLDSLIQHPASMTHAGVPKALREKAGLSDNLVRLSVGLEDIKDLIADLEAALSKC